MTQELPKVDIVLVGDKNKVSKDCIESIRKTTEKFNIYLEPYNGYNKSLNNGAKKGDSEYIVFCNNDLVFHKGWLQPLIYGLETYDSVSAWCPKTHEQWWGINRKPVKPYRGYQVGKCIAGWLIMMKRLTWEIIGGFDERFTFWYCDNAYAEQLKKNKLSHALIPYSEVTHLQSTTLMKQSDSVKRNLTTDQTKLFKSIYGHNR